MKGEARGTWVFGHISDCITKEMRDRTTHRWMVSASVGNF